FLHHVPLLVHLDRVDAAVLAGVAVLGHGRLERLGDLADAVPQDVGEPQEDGELNAAELELIDEVFQVDGVVGPLVGVDGDVAAGVDSEIALPPAVDAVHLDGVLDLPLFFHQADTPGAGGTRGRIHRLRAGRV